VSFFPSRPRREPYTQAGIRRCRCSRCGAPAVHQWSACADGNNFRPLCLDCDIALNELVLAWMGDPNAAAKVARYAQEQRA
jgi:hypothetical protein